MASWLVNGPFLNEVRSLAKIPASTLLENVIQIANQELNRELSKGVYLRGQLDKATARRRHRRPARPRGASARHGPPLGRDLQGQLDPRPPKKVRRDQEGGRLDGKQ